MIAELAVPFNAISLFLFQVSCISESHWNVPTSGWVLMVSSKPVLRMCP